MARSRGLRRTSIALIAGLATALAGCASDAPQDTFKAAGPQARKIRNLALPIGGIAIGVGVIVFTVIAVLLVKFRDKGDGREPKQLHGNTPLEIGWTILPAVLLAAIAIPTITTIFDLARKPADPLEISVIGQQWWWEFDYPKDKIVTANELVIPAGKDVYLSITSRDVIHSFWLPRLNGKKDAVPGRVHKLTIHADKPGDFWGQCTEFCGLSHANMRIRARALAPDDYAAWVANQQKARVAPVSDSAKAGETVFKAKCASCHQINGLTDDKGNPIIVDASKSLIAGAAPNLTHLASRMTFAGSTYPLYLSGDPYDPNSTLVPNRTKLEDWLRNPNALIPMAASERRGMPNLKLSEDEINSLVDYLLTLK